MHTHDWDWRCLWCWVRLWRNWAWLLIAILYLLTTLTLVYLFKDLAQ